MCAGDYMRPSCTLAYAPPEVAAAMRERTLVRVDAAHDVWALGQMAFEAIVGAETRHFRSPSPSPSGSPASRGAPRVLPWELPAEAQPAAWRESRLRTIVEPCLHRDPALRPSAAQLLARLHALGVFAPASK